MATIALILVGCILAVFVIVLVIFHKVTLGVPYAPHWRCRQGFHKTVIRQHPDSLFYTTCELCDLIFYD